MTTYLSSVTTLHTAQQENILQRHLTVIYQTTEYAKKKLTILHRDVKFLAPISYTRTIDVGPRPARHHHLAWSEDPLFVSEGHDAHSSTYSSVRASSSIKYSTRGMILKTTYLLTYSLKVIL